MTDCTADQLCAFLDARDGVLFDFNGTLSDDEAELELAYHQGLLETDLPGLAEGEYGALLGRSEPEIAAALLSRRGRAASQTGPLLDSVSRQYTEICARSPRVADLSVRLVDWLEAAGLRVGIVTGTLRPLIEPVLAQRGLARLTRTLVCAEDVAVGKPDPSGFLLGAERLGLAPARILVFEDSPAGMAAAHSAGMTAVGIGAHAGTELHFDTMVEVARIVLSRDLGRR